MSLIDPRRVIADPLVHFLVLGAGLFLLYAAVSPETEADGPSALQVEITAEELELMRDDWKKQWRRLPTPDEMDRLIDERIREEILYREALEMGLDQGDPAIRRQMAEKVLFMFQDLAPDEEPTEEQLNQFLAANPDRYALPARISFRQVFFDPGKRASANDDAASALAAVDGSGKDPVGDELQLGGEFTAVTGDQLERLLGKAFASQLLGMTDEGWSGPIESDYGSHLVNIMSYEPARPAELAMVRDKVLADLVASRREALADDFYNEAKQRYSIEIATAATAQVATE
ncbi:MAG: peptidylprolyl isomerase [Gammaproteobacteria bacterium]|nr:peptidylprolyl isomerase [Gammaproteobacteria bacterium]